MNKYNLLPTPDREKKTLQIIQDLLAKKGIVQYALFHLNEEASRYLPGGLYPESGKVLNSDGRVFSFWLDWDEEKQDYTLGRNILESDGSTYSFWHEVDPMGYEGNEYFIQAKKSLGLF